jgi:regulatory protein
VTSSSEFGAASPERDATLEDNEKTFARAKNTAYRLLTVRPRSRSEISDTLRGRGFNDAVSEQVIAELERYGYVNDRQFAEQWAAGRVRTRGFGRRRVEQELRGKGVNAGIVREVMRATFSPGFEETVAKQTAERKLRSLQNIDPFTRKRRLAGFLERKGFPSDIIHSVIRTMTTACTTEEGDE